jgi:ATP-binding cassette subfamily B protein
VGVLVVLSPPLAAVSIVALPVLIAASWAFHHGAGRAYHAIRDRVAETLTVLQEGLSGVRVVQAFRRERHTIEAYKPRSRAQIGAWRRASFVNIRLFTMIPLAQTVALVAVLLVAASMYRHGSISQGTIAAYVLYLVQLFDPIARFSEWLGEFRQGLAALGKVVGLIQTENAVSERAGAVELPADGALELRGVTFGYSGGGPVVKNVSLKLQAGPAAGLDRARRRRPARRRAPIATAANRDAAPGGPPLQRHDREQRQARRSGRAGRGGAARARPDRRTRAVRVAAGRDPHRRPVTWGAALGG